MSIYDTWNGLTFGHDGTDEDYPLEATPGTYDANAGGENLAGGFGGAAVVPLFDRPARWSTRVAIRGADDATWRQRRDDLMAATATREILPYVSNEGSTSYTRFAQVVDRSIPRDSDGEVNHHTVASIDFYSPDPKSYGPIETLTFTGTSDSEVVTSDGWAVSERWVWTVPGPVTNPRLSSTAQPGATIRYLGTIASGLTLVVELLPRGWSPGYYAKVVANADVANFRTPGVGLNAYVNLDGGASGANRPPQWFGIEPGAQTISYASTSGTGGSTLVWREAFI